MNVKLTRTAVAVEDGYMVIAPAGSHGEIAGIVGLLPATITVTIWNACVITQQTGARSIEEWDMDVQAKDIESLSDPAQALAEIAEVMSGRQWNADVAEGIARIVRAAGFTVEDIE